MAGKRDQLLTHPGKAIGPIPGPTATTTTLIKTIQTIEVFVKSADWPERARDTWKYIKEIAFSYISYNISNVSQDIQELKI